VDVRHGDAVPAPWSAKKIIVSLHPGNPVFAATAGAGANQVPKKPTATGPALSIAGHPRSLGSQRCREIIIMKPQIAVIGIATVLVLTNATAAEPVEWQRYVVPQTGASVDIPATVFTRDAGSPRTGYGRRFLTSDGRANLTVQSFANDADDSPAAFLARKNPPTDIVYKRVTSRFFVVSSFRNDMIWYNRCNFAGRFINCVLINYPAAEKRRWDSVVTRISNSLAGGAARLTSG
jgi:hypothetical protein